MNRILKLLLVSSVGATASDDFGKDIPMVETGES